MSAGGLKRQTFAKKFVFLHLLLALCNTVSLICSMNWTKKFKVPSDIPAVSNSGQRRSTRRAHMKPVMFPVGRPLNTTHTHATKLSTSICLRCHKQIVKARLEPTRDRRRAPPPSQHSRPTNSSPFIMQHISQSSFPISGKNKLPFSLFCAFLHHLQHFSAAPPPLALNASQHEQLFLFSVLFLEKAS